MCHGTEEEKTQGDLAKDKEAEMKPGTCSLHTMMMMMIIPIYAC